MIDLKVVIAGVGSRLKEARKKLGLSQFDVSEAGGVGRTAQVSYESGITAPDTNYLERIQSTKIDLPFVLGGQSLSDLLNPNLKDQNVNWSLVQQVFDDVAFFCERFAPGCPSSYRWELIAELYRINSNKLNAKDSPDRLARQDQIQKLWEKQL